MHMFIYIIHAYLIAM